MIQRFYDIAAGSRFHGAAVIAYASTGEFARFHPHLHAIVLEGGFDRQGRFVHISRPDLLYSYRSRSTRLRTPHRVRLAPEGWQAGSSGVWPLWFPGAHSSRDHRAPAGAQNPTSPHQDGQSSAGFGPRLRSRLDLAVIP